jgi:hypothetical protein
MCIGTVTEPYQISPRDCQIRPRTSFTQRRFCSRPIRHCESKSSNERWEQVDESRSVLLLSQPIYIWVFFSDFLFSIGILCYKNYTALSFFYPSDWSFFPWSWTAGYSLDYMRCRPENYSRFIRQKVKPSLYRSRHAVRPPGVRDFYNFYIFGKWS